MTYTAKAAQYKKDRTKSLVELMKEYPVLGLVNVENLPSAQLQVLRGKLRKEVLMLMSKKILIKRAIEATKDSKKDFEKLNDYVKGMPALLFTKQNPFKIATLIRASKSKAPAKSGQVAPFDLIIPAGPTQFTPGPIISELGAIGLKTGVENGKIVIKEPAVIVKKDEVITKKAADALAKFNIEPMEIGLDLVAAYEDGLIYDKDVLSIDPEEYVTMIKTAAAESLGLSVEIAYPTKENIERLIGVAYKSTKHIAIEQNIMSDVLAEKQVGDAYKAAKSIAEDAKIDIDKAPAAEEKKAEVKETPVEEKKPEVKETPAEEKPKEAPVEEKKPEVKEEPKEPEVKEQPKQAPVEEKKPEVKEEPKKAPKETTEAKTTGPADVISEQYKDEIKSEKDRRDNIDVQKAEELVNQLKKKGTLR